MVSRLFQCDPDQLRAFLEGGLNTSEQAELSDHIEHCQDCQWALERLAAGSGLWRELRHLDLAANPAMRSAPLEGEAARSGGARVRAGGELLEFLAPSDDPTHLGRLGRYAVIGVLGEGGMGIVLKAFDSTLNRVVAIKVLVPQLAASGAARRRFAREAKAAAAVVHDHVVAIHAVDTDSDSGLPYLVMPFVAGRSLQERIDCEGPLR